MFSLKGKIKVEHMKITNFLILDSNGEHIDSDAFGDNVAFRCCGCGYPVLAIALENQRGSDEDHPSECKGCGEEYFLDIRERTEKLYIHSLREYNASNI